MKNSISDPSKKVQISTKVTLNEDVEIFVGYDVLNNLIGGLPYDYSPELADFYNLCARSSSSEVRESIACKNNLPENIINLLVNDENIDVVKRIINDRDYQKYITQEQVENLLSLKNKDIDSILADDFDDFINCNPEFIISNLIEHQDPSIRKDLADNRSLPLKYRNKLKKDPDPNVVLAAKKDDCHR